MGMNNTIFEKALKILSIPALEYVLRDIQTRIADGVESGHSAYIEQQTQLEHFVLSELDLRKKEMH